MKNKSNTKLVVRLRKGQKVKMKPLRQVVDLPDFHSNYWAQQAKLNSREIYEVEMVDSMFVRLKGKMFCHLAKNFVPVTTKVNK